jgi:tRNA-Thr(GGU) m(6)t(6)A37 methyltransferase TsaA
MKDVKVETFEIEVIGRIYTDFPSKFGIPRQSGLVESLEGKIIFEPKFRSEAAVKGLENHSHLWLIWQFSEVADKGWSPTVRPPRLGGNTRVGVFASRSPFRPNHLGLSSVKLVKIEMDENLGPILYVSGVDLMDNTPILDIKPYIPYADSHPEAYTGVFEHVEKKKLKVYIPQELLDKVPSNKREVMKEVLAEDPRPSYQHDAQRIYGLSFAGLNIRFRVDGDKLTVLEVEDL